MTSGGFRVPVAINRGGAGVLQALSLQVPETDSGV